MASSSSSFRQNSILILGGVLIVAGLLLRTVIVPALSEQKPSDCTSSQKYDTSTKHCRAKTTEEKEADRKEQEAIARKAKLEAEARAGKQNGTICLTASESWESIGKTTCVVYHPEYLFRTGDGYLFLDEKKDYKTGFVAFFGKRNMLSWNDFLARYQSVNLIAVYGQINLYEGHPQIKVYDLGQVTTPQLINCETSYGCIYSRGN